MPEQEGQQQQGGNDEVDHLVKRELGDDFTDEDARKLLNTRKGSDTSGDDDDSDESGSTGDSKYDEIIAGRRKAREERDKIRKELEAARAKLQEFENAKLSESERLQKERDELKSKAEKAQSELSRMRIAAETAPDGATLAQLRKVAKYLRDDDGDLEAAAKELWDDFGPRSAPKPPASKPKEKLRGGTGDPDEDDDTGLDPAKLAALIPRAR